MKRDLFAALKEDMAELAAIGDVKLAARKMDTEGACQNW